MLDNYIYHNVQDNKVRFILLYGIYATCFFGICSLTKTIINLSFAVKVLIALAIITFFITLRFKDNLKDMAVQYY